MVPERAAGAAARTPLRGAAALAVTLATLAAGAAHAAPAARVFFLEPEGKTCTAKVRTLPDGDDRVLFSTTSACPDEVLWDVRAGRIWSTEGGHLWWRPLHGGAAHDMGPLPAPALVRLWIDAGGAVRASYVVPVKDDDVASLGGKVSVRFEGKSYDAPEWFPSWGTPAMAILVELRGAAGRAGTAGKWERLQAVPTKIEAGDTPGVDVLQRPSKRAGVVALADLLDASTCLGTGPIHCGDETPGLKELLGSPDDICVLPVGDKHMLAISGVMGDSRHCTRPVYLCEPGCKTGKKKRIAEAKATQLSVASSAAGYFIVGDEYTNAHAHVLDDAGAPATTLPGGATSVVFLPASLP